MAELERTMGAQELADWVEYYGAEPWGAYRDNLHAGIIASTLANMHRRKGTKAMKPGDFVLQTVGDKRKRDTERSLNWLRAMAKRG